MIVGPDRNHHHALDAVLSPGVHRRKGNRLSGTILSARWDVISGCIVTDVIAFFIVVACAATIFKTGHGELRTPRKPLWPCGPSQDNLRPCYLRSGLLTLRCFRPRSCRSRRRTTSVKALVSSTASNGAFPRRRSSTGLYTLLIVCGAGFVLIPRLPLLKVLLFSQVANGVLLPFVLFYMLTLINRKQIMQEYTNNIWQNVIAWTTAIVMIGLTVGMIWTTLM